MLAKEKRKIYLRKIKGFWEEFSQKKIGLCGILIVGLFLFAAIFAPWLTPYDPEKELTGVADGFAMPQWMTIFPGYGDVPPTMRWSPDWTPTEESLLVNAEVEGGRFVILYNATGATALRITRFPVAFNFSYPYGPPNTFSIEFDWKAAPEFIDTQTTTKYSLELVLKSPSGLSYSIWDLGFPESTIKESPPFSGEARQHHDHISSVLNLPERLGYKPWQGKQMVQDIFAEKGEYSLLFYVSFLPIRYNATCKISIWAEKLEVLGLVHGILGTDNLGHDIFAQLIYGVRISLAIGLLAAVVATTIGVLVGVVAGFVGGIVDETLMRMVDVLLCLPVLPLILALICIYGRSVWYIVVIIGIFGWQGLSRMIRSQVLSIRETPFVESAIASGANKPYIMYRHILPNVFPIIAANVVLSVPLAILLEAGLSFIGFGDPQTATWGRMLQRAYDFGAFRQLAWWWIVPPGLAITLVCLSFVFLGHAVDEIVNPRLRRRR